METRPYFRILKELSKKFGQKVNISELGAQLFPDKRTKDDLHVKNPQLERFLFAMKESGHINYESRLLPMSSTSIYQQTEVIAAITTPGFDFYKLNKTTKWASIRSWIAIVIAGIAAAFTGWPLFNKHNVKPEEIKSQSAKSTIKPQQKQPTNPKIPNKDTARKYPSH